MSRLRGFPCVSSHEVRPRQFPQEIREHAEAEGVLSSGKAAPREYRKRRESIGGK